MVFRPFNWNTYGYNQYIIWPLEIVWINPTVPADIIKFKFSVHGTSVLPYGAGQEDSTEKSFRTFPQSPFGTVIIGFWVEITHITYGTGGTGDRHFYRSSQVEIFFKKEADVKSIDDVTKIIFPERSYVIEFFSRECI